MRRGQAFESVVHHRHHLPVRARVEPQRDVTYRQVNGAAVAFFDRERSARGEPTPPTWGVILHDF